MSNMRMMNIWVETPNADPGPPDLSQLQEHVDVPLLRKAVEWAEVEAAKPVAESQWNQKHWIINGDEVGRECGTCYCIAGYVARLTDPRFETAEGMADAYDAVIDGGMSTNAHPRFIAMEALGLSKLSASWLFDAENSISDVRRIAESIAGEAL